MKDKNQDLKTSAEYQVGFGLRGDADAFSNSDQAKSYAILQIERLRRNAARTAVREFGKVILTRIVEELFLATGPVFDENDALTEGARATAWETLEWLVQDGELDYLLDAYANPDVFNQICADHKEAFLQGKQLRKALEVGRKSEASAITVRFHATDYPAPVSVAIKLDEVTSEQRGWLADRLINNDVCQLYHGGDGTVKVRHQNREPALVIAEAPSIEALLVAIEEEEMMIEQRREQHRACALVAARHIW